MYCVPTLTSTIVQVVINVLKYSFIFFFVYSLQTEISFSCMIFYSKEYAFNGTTKRHNDNEHRELCDSVIFVYE